MSMQTELFEALNPDSTSKEEIVHPSLSYWQDVWQRFSKNRIATCGLLFLIVLTLFAIFGPFISPHLYYETTLALKNHPPSKEYWFGTDDLGRDMFSRTCWGARISLFIGVTAALIDLCIGVVWGGLAAHLGGRVDSILMRLADILYAIPYLLVVILLMVVMGSGLLPIIIALSITGWVGMARIVRGQILQLKQQEYIQAAIALGASSSRILFKHLIPNTMGSIIVTMTLTIPIAIFTEAFLSFLGLGVSAPMASWGTMASDGLPAMRYYPWRLFFPAAFISLTMLALNLMGDGLRDAIDPKL
ncbi:MAG: ABC transporter permease, partial [Chlamydiia bacterium]|nr:ABC transporter permease [Chlamydiia bacterium]